MLAKGTFTVSLEPQSDEVAPAGRMLISKQYTGGLVGSGVGQMVSKRTESGAAVYAAIEEFSGSVAGIEGSFTLIHSGEMSTNGQLLEVKIVEGSGVDGLQGISGSLEIIQEDGEHEYVLDYEV